MNQQSSTAQQRHASHRDAIGHSSVQPWSAGALFPCVIARVERYAAARTYHVRGMVGNVCHRAVSLQADSEQQALAEALARIGGGYYLEVYAIERASVSYELIAYGRREEYATREDAEKVARHLNVSPAMRAAWQRGAIDSVKARGRWGQS